MRWKRTREKDRWEYKVEAGRGRGRQKKTARKSTKVRGECERARGKRTIFPLLLYTQQRGEHNTTWSSPTGATRTTHFTLVCFFTRGNRSANSCLAGREVSAANARWSRIFQTGIPQRLSSCPRLLSPPPSLPRSLFLSKSREWIASPKV